MKWLQVIPVGVEPTLALGLSQRPLPVGIRNLYAALMDQNVSVSTPLIAGVFLLLGVLITQLFNRRNEASSWIRKERLEAYRELRAATLEYADQSDTQNLSKYEVAYERALITATARQAHDYMLLNLMVKSNPESENFRQNIVYQMDPISQSTRSAIGMAFQNPRRDRWEVWMKEHRYGSALPVAFFVVVIQWAAILCAGYFLFSWLMSL